MPTLLKRLLDQAITRVNRRDLSHLFQEILDALEETYVLISISGPDGGEWLYKITGQQFLEIVSDSNRQEFSKRYFYISMPDWALYDILLKEISPIEASNYTRWGGSRDAHPTWTFIKTTKLFELLQTAVELG